jgi:hypothetical protein
MKVQLWSLLIVLAHPCLGQDTTSVLSKFELIDRDIPLIKPEKARSPILRQKISRTLAAWEKFQPVVKHPEEWHGGTFAESYGSQLEEDQRSIHKIVSSHGFSKGGYLDTDQSLRWSKDILCIAYLIMVPLIGGCIMATSQIALCVAPKHSRKKPPKAGETDSPRHSP